jgi:muramoyltetrapeptide carboxypeptidase LdcA involved in peptidoglycan recycling
MNHPKIYPTKLQAGDEVRVVAPSRSLSIISKELRKLPIVDFLI